MIDTPKDGAREAAVTPAGTAPAPQDVSAASPAPNTAKAGSKAAGPSPGAPGPTPRGLRSRILDAAAALAGTGKGPQNAERNISHAMRIERHRPSVVRLSRKALVGLGGVAALVLSGALFYALAKPRPPAAPPELVNTDTRQTSDALNALPKDYSGIPRLGPPLPGDLGRPMVAAGVAPGQGTPETRPNPLSTPADARAQAREQARLRLAQERDAARNARLFAAQAQAAGSGALASTPASVPDGAAPVTAPLVDPRQSILTKTVDQQTVASDRLTAPAGPYVLQAGAVIPAAMITGLRSDLPGPITAQVTENVFDGPTGRVVLIPQGTRLIGEYQSETRFGQKRALLVWTRLILTDGRSMLLDRQPGADAAGAAGLADHVDNHWGQIFKAALITTILSIGSEAGPSAEEAALTRALRRGGSDAASQIGQQLVGRSLNIRPTIAIRQGFRVRVIVTRDLVLEPWKG